MEMDRRELIDRARHCLDLLWQPSGVPVASLGPHYRQTWIRDTVYCALPFLETDKARFARAIRTLWEWIQRAEEQHHKLTWAIKQRPDSSEPWRHIHAKYHPDGNEVTEAWGHHQNDAYGLLLWATGIGEAQGLQCLPAGSGYPNYPLLRLFIRYLHGMEPWQCPDYGVWENNYEVHASSAGAVHAGSSAILPLITDGSLEDRMAWDLACRTGRALQQLSPRESAIHDADLALLSLIYPFGVVQGEQAQAVIHQVEQLVRPHGIIRYYGDDYYGHEAEWPMGFSWLAIAYARQGDLKLAYHYLQRAEAVNGGPAPFPELYENGMANDNTPLGWNAALYLLAIQEISRAAQGKGAHEPWMSESMATPSRSS